MNGYSCFPGFEKQAERQALRKTVSSVSFAFIVYFASVFFIIAPFALFADSAVYSVADICGMISGDSGALDFADTVINSELYSEIVNMVVYILSLSIPLFAIRLFTGEKKLFGIGFDEELYPYTGKNRSFVFKNILPLAFMSMLMSMSLSLLAYSSGWMSSAEDSFPTETAAIIVYFIEIAVLPPIFEELLFRGALLRVFLPYGRCVAVLLSSVFFGGLHSTGQNIAYAFGTGLILALAAVESGSLIPSMTIHFINNVLVFAQSLGCFVYPELEAEIQSVATALFMFLGLISIFFVFGRRERICTDVCETGYMTSGEKLRTSITPAFLGFLIAVFLLALYSRVALG